MNRTRTMVGAAVIAALAAGAAPAGANQKNLTPEEKQQKLTKKMTDLDQRLNLTAGQETQVRSILQQKMDGSLEREAAFSQIEATLTPEQRSKFSSIKAEWQQEKSSKKKT